MDLVFFQILAAGVAFLAEAVDSSMGMLQGTLVSVVLVGLGFFVLVRTRLLG